MAAPGLSSAQPSPLEAGEEPRTKTAMVLEYEARRCHICRCPQPAFGFGPPLTRPGQELWACGLHRATVEAMLAPASRLSRDVSGQPSLLR